MAKKKPASEESAAVKQPEIEENNRCFIITPIGEESTEIRRATEGLVDAVLVPVLEEYGLIAEVAHHSFELRSITGRIVEHVVESRLVIANLTGLNPNVMYELAVRHAAAKPVIIIAERGTRLPFDINDELTFFYDNDMRGVVELRIQLQQTVRHALQSEKIDNPVVRYKQQALIELKGEAPEALQLILDRLNGFELAQRDRRRGGKIGYESPGPDAFRNEAVRVDGPAIAIEANKRQLLMSFHLAQKGVHLDWVQSLPTVNDRVIMFVKCPLLMMKDDLQQIVADAFVEQGCDVIEVLAGERFF